MKKVAIPDVIFGAFTRGQHGDAKGSLFFILCEKAHVRRDKFLFSISFQLVDTKGT